MNQKAIAAKRGIQNSPVIKIVSRFFRTCPVASQFINQIPHTNPKGFGYSQKGVKANPLLPPFNFANVNRMQTGLLCQFFLTHAGLVTMFPNGISQDFKLSRARHSLLGKQAHAKLKTPNMGLFLSCKFLVERVKTHSNSERIS